MSELGSVLGVQQIEEAGVEAADVVVEGVDEHPEGKVPLQLGRRPGEHERPAAIRAQRELIEQAGLADAGFAHHLDG